MLPEAWETTACPQSPTGVTGMASTACAGNHPVAQLVGNAQSTCRTQMVLELLKADNHQAFFKNQEFIETKGFFTGRVHLREYALFALTK